MCIRHTAASLPASASSAPGACSARTSLIIAAPAASAARITAGFIVSTETTIPAAASSFVSGTTRAISSSSSTGAAPGRVDSPPMSIDIGAIVRHLPRAHECVGAVRIATAVGERNPA